jgi:hypothetical protein
MFPPVHFSPRKKTSRTPINIGKRKVFDNELLKNYFITYFAVCALCGEYYAYEATVSGIFNLSFLWLFHNGWRAYFHRHTPATEFDRRHELSTLALFDSIFFQSQLHGEKYVRVLPDSSIDFAFRELKLQPDQSLKPDQVRKLGEVIEAREVLWGSYQREDGKWNLTMQIITVGTGKASKSLAVSSPDMFQAVSEIRKGVLRQLGITPTKEEEQQMSRPLTSSTEALECLSRGYAYTKKDISVSNVVVNLQQAVSLDRQFAMAQQGLAHFLLLQGKITPFYIWPWPGTWD